MLRLKQNQFAHSVEEGLRAGMLKADRWRGNGNLVLESRGFQSRVFSTMHLDSPKGLTTTHKGMGWGNSKPPAHWNELV